MELTPELIDHLAYLSRLEFTEAAKKEIQEDLQKMLAFVEKLAEIDTTGVKPLLHMGQAVNVLRADEVGGSVDRVTALRNAPEANDTFFRVPKVIRK